MKSSVGILLSVFSSTISAAQERLPIIDMHLRAIPAESVRDEVAILGLAMEGRCRIEERQIDSYC
jgi:hypothetical protein